MADRSSLPEPAVEGAHRADSVAAADSSDRSAGKPAHGAPGFDVSEFATPTAGPSSPFGDVEFPLSTDALGYVHPGRRERPHLAGE